MNKIKEEWEDYRKVAIHRDAPELQVAVCKEAFYAGAVSVFNKLVSVKDQRQGERDILTIQRELESYIKNFKQVL